MNVCRQCRIVSAVPVVADESSPKETLFVTMRADSLPKSLIDRVQPSNSLSPRRKLQSLSSESEADGLQLTILLLRGRSLSDTAPPT
jgi:hypothetical protein